MRESYGFNQVNVFTFVFLVSTLPMFAIAYVAGQRRCVDQDLLPLR